MNADTQDQTSPGWIIQMIGYLLGWLAADLLFVLCWYAYKTSSNSGAKQIAGSTAMTGIELVLVVGLCLAVVHVIFMQTSQFDLKTTPTIRAFISSAITGAVALPVAGVVIYAITQISPSPNLILLLGTVAIAGFGASFTVAALYFGARHRKKTS